MKHAGWVVRRGRRVSLRRRLRPAVFTPHPGSRIPHWQVRPTFQGRRPPAAGAWALGVALTAEKQRTMNTNPRQAAIQAIAAARYKLDRVNFKDQHLKHLFGENVFNEAVQRERL